MGVVSSEKSNPGGVSVAGKAVAWRPPSCRPSGRSVRRSVASSAAAAAHSRPASRERAACRPSIGEQSPVRRGWWLSLAARDLQASLHPPQLRSSRSQEVDIGQAADVGTLQRLPHAIGSRSLVCEMVFTARKMFSDEAKSSGLVSRIYDNKASMMEGALQLAEDIASKSPVAVQGSKVNLLYARDHSVPESLEYMAAWNMAMLQTNDIMKSATAVFQKKNLKENIYTNL